MIKVAWFILLSYILTGIICVVDPPSPNRIKDLINNSSMEPDYYEQFIVHTDSEFMPDIRAINGIHDFSQQQEVPKKRQRKFDSEEERRAAKKERDLLYNRTKRRNYKRLPEGDERKEARRKKDIEYHRNKRAAIKSLPDGDERKEAYRLYRNRVSRERRAFITSLPDDDKRKQSHINTIKQSQKRYGIRKKQENPKHFTDKQRERRKRIRERARS